MQATLISVDEYLQLKANAEQLTQPARWRLILSAAFRAFLGGRVLGSRAKLAEAIG
jgi:hypothetical protein